MDLIKNGSGIFAADLSEEHDEISDRIIFHLFTLNVVYGEGGSVAYHRVVLEGHLATSDESSTTS